MPRNNKPVIIGAAILGILAIGLTLILMMGKPPAAPVQGPNGGSEQPVEQPKVTQFVARRDIPPRVELTSSMFQAIETDPKAVPKGALTTLTDVEGKISAATIRRGQAVTSDLTIDPITRVIPANMPIPDGTRAVAMWVNPNETVAGLVDVGDHVDVIVNHKFTLDKGQDTVLLGATDITSARTIAQDLRVLAVDRSISAAAAPKPTPQTGGQQAAPTPTPVPAAQATNPRIRVVVAASPADAERIVAANEEGTIHLTLRNPSSRERFPIPEAREYPSRLVVVAKRPEGGNGGGGTARNPSGPSAAEMRAMMAAQQPSSPSMQPPMPAPVAPASVAPAQVIPDKEVTVIRGTEKTRVIVPR